MRLAGWLHRQGIGEGAVVALVMKNSPAFLELTFAVSHLGAVLLPVNYRLAAAEIVYIADHAGAAMVLVDEELASLAAKVTVPVVTVTAAMQADSRVLAGRDAEPVRSEEHTSELQSLMRISSAVFCLT